MRKSFKFRFHFAFLFLVLWIPLCWSSVGQEAFDLGASAYRAGQYSKALQYFLQAQREDNASEQLHYNLGVTYYRLGDYLEARVVFEELSHHPNFSALAHYNLGLVALKTSDSQQAGKEFDVARQASNNPQLRSLATEQLRRFPVRQESRFSGFLNLGAGYDNNVALSSDAGVVAPSQRSSSLLSLLTGGRAQLTGDSRNGLQLAGSYYGAYYPSLTKNNLNYLRTGPQYRYGTGDIRTMVGLYGGYLTFGGKTFETLGTLSVRIWGKLSENQELSSEYFYNRIVGGSGYDNLSGWQQSFKIEDIWTLGAASLSGGYRLELNRRNDLERAPEFFSASPTRNHVFTSVDLPLNALTRTSFGLEYARSCYNKTDRIMQGGALVSIDRRDQRYTGFVNLSHEIAPNWSLVGEYRYLRNQSNIDTYRYISHRFELRIEHQFL